MTSHELIPFETAFGFEALRQAALRAARGKRSRGPGARFMARLEKQVFALERALSRGTWQRVVRYFEGDDLFTPAQRRRGLPIGNLTSQFFANVYLDRLDHYIKEVLQAPGYVRYVDDFAVFGESPGQLTAWKSAIERFLDRRRLLLHPRKTYVGRTLEPLTFVGYLRMPNGARFIRPDNVERFCRRLQGYRELYRAQQMSIEEVDAHVLGWVAHARHAATWRLRHHLFRGGRYDPARNPASP